MTVLIAAGGFFSACALEGQDAPSEGKVSDPVLPEAKADPAEPQAHEAAPSEIKVLEILEDVSRDSAAERPPLKKKAPAAPRKAAKKAPKKRPAAKPIEIDRDRPIEEAPAGDAAEVDAPGSEGPEGYTWMPGGWYPWYRLPPSERMGNHPPSITHVPQLGLQHNYPEALQMGLRMPVEADPIRDEPGLGPFVGVVGAAKARLRAEEERLRNERPRTGDALKLLKGGKYRESGLILANRFQESDHPVYPLLLTEVFFGLGKFQHAEACLRNALASPAILDALSDDVVSHFPSGDIFEAKLQDLVSSGENRLLAAYLLVHSKNPDQGVDLLQRLSDKDARDPSAALLYRHYLLKIFRD